MKNGCEIEIREPGEKPIRFYKESGFGPAFVALLFREARLLRMKGEINDVASFIIETSTFKPVNKILYKNIKYFCELDITKNYDGWLMTIGISSAGKIRHLLDIPVKKLTEDTIERIIALEQQDLIGATEF